MNLNRNNYEEYFLLYVDNELSAAERKEVEEFVASHPDLQEELDTLMDMILSPDDIHFADKSSLLRFTEESASVISEENAQYWMLLQVDGELKGNKQKELELFLEQHPVQQKEFDLLQQTKLEIDPAIIFADKASLYRKEEVKVVHISWQRIAIASALLLFVAATIIFQQTSNKKGTEIVQQSAPGKNNSSDPVTTSGDDNKSSLNDKSNQQSLADIKNENIPDSQAASKELKNEQAAITNYSHENKNNKRVIVAEMPDNNKVANQDKIKKDLIIKPQPLTNNIEELKRIQQDVAITKKDNDNSNKIELPVKQAEPSIKDLLNKVADNNTSVAANNPVVAQNTPVVFTPEDNDRSSSSKKGLRSFFRKVGRTISRTAGIGGGEDRENKILVGGLAIAK